MRNALKRALLLATDLAQVAATVIALLGIVLYSVCCLLPFYWWQWVKERASTGAEG